MKRRYFLEFLGKGVVTTSLLPPFISACNRANSRSTNVIQGAIPGIEPSDLDDVVLADGLDYELLISFDDPIGKKDTFGFNNDYIAFVPGENDNEGLLWVNHEYVNPMFVSDYIGGDRTKKQVKKELYHMGGSILKIRNENGSWKVVKDDPKNRRITGLTMIPFAGGQKIMGADEAMGTLQNCAGGITPWGTIISCEENYHICWGERDFETGEIGYEGGYGYREFYDNPPEHYGWCVEVDPNTGEAKKHVSLGRCAHECATTVELEDGRVVVYTADDKVDECVYKFISDKPRSLESGKLYVANLEGQRWESLQISERPELRDLFTSQTEVMVRLREAAKLVGGTPLARPEDVEIDPVTGNVLIALTNDYTKKNYFGQILKIIEKDGNFESLEMTSEIFKAGGEETGFACPDNMAFDHAGNLWFTSDISGRAMHRAPYKAFKNNGLFVVPRAGQQEGQVIQVGSAPTDAEFTGPFFSPDGKTLFLSVQHPGEQSESMDELTSHWPGGGDAVPKPAVITIQGELLEKIQGIS